MHLFFCICYYSVPSKIYRKYGIWYRNGNTSKMNPGILALIYWGASLMWFVDAIFEFAELKAAYFTPEPIEMLNDAFLGFVVVAFGLLIWTVHLLVTDPKGRIKESFFGCARKNDEVVKTMTVRD